jgi:glycosyltransferase involved in cell wall biosynthesis
MHHVYGIQGTGDGRAFDAVIPNFFDASQFSVARKPTGDYLLFIGRIILRKGPHVAMEIAKRAGLPLYVAGPGATHVTEGRITGADGVVIEGDCQHIGPVGFEARNQLMRNAAATIVPTLYIEPFGGVAVEAMLAGCPVVASDWGAFSENVTPDVGARFRTPIQGAAAVAEVQKLNRKDIRRAAKARFSQEAVGPLFTRWFDSLDTLWERGYDQ